MLFTNYHCRYMDICMGLSLLVSLVSLEYGSMSSERGPLALFLILRWLGFCTWARWFISFCFLNFSFPNIWVEFIRFCVCAFFYSVLLSHLKPISINLQSGEYFLAIGFGSFIKRYIKYNTFYIIYDPNQHTAWRQLLAIGFGSSIK